MSALRLASFYMYSKSKERARGLTERVLRSQPDSIEALTLLGWIIVLQQQDDEMDITVDASELDEALEHFEAVLEHDVDNIQALMGKARVQELKHNLPGSLETLTEVNIKFGWFSPALVEKARLLLAMNDWEQMMEHVTRLLQKDAQNIAALGWMALHQLVRDGNIKNSTKTLQVCFQVLINYNNYEERNCGRVEESSGRETPSTRWRWKFSSG